MCSKGDRNLTIDPERGGGGNEGVKLGNDNTYNGVPVVWSNGRRIWNFCNYSICSHGDQNLAIHGGGTAKSKKYAKGNAVEPEVLAEATAEAAQVPLNQMEVMVVKNNATQLGTNNTFNGVTSIWTNGPRIWTFFNCSCSSNGSKDVTLQP